MEVDRFHISLSQIQSPFFMSLSEGYLLITFFHDDLHFLFIFEAIKVSNADLTNIVDTLSLIECMTGKWEAKRLNATLNAFDLRDPVKYMFESKKAGLPLNMYFIQQESEVIDVVGNVHEGVAVDDGAKMEYKPKKNSRVQFFYKNDKKIKENWNPKY